MDGSTIQASSLSIQGVQHPSTIYDGQLLVPSTLDAGLDAQTPVTCPKMGLECSEHLGGLVH